MDPIKGAEMLAYRVGSIERENTKRTLVPESALPLFHWLGVEPAVDGSSTSTSGGSVSTHDVPGVRRLRFRNRSV